MNVPPKITVLGSANVDLTFRTPRLPLPGETLSGRSLHVGQGGKGANQAVAAARLGAQVSFIARVGNDSFGREAMKSYHADGIDTTHVRIDEQLPTGTAAIMLDDAAENCIMSSPGPTRPCRRMTCGQRHRKSERPTRCCASLRRQWMRPWRHS